LAGSQSWGSGSRFNSEQWAQENQRQGKEDGAIHNRRTHRWIDLGRASDIARLLLQQEGSAMSLNELPPLSAIDRRDKMQLWLATEVLEQGVWDLDKFYDLLESHFAFVSTWRELNR